MISTHDSRLEADTAQSVPLLGINWMLDSGYGAGVLGINIVLELCRTRSIRPVLFSKPGRIVVDPLSARLLEWAATPTNIPDGNASVRIPMVYTTGDDFVHEMHVKTEGPKFAIMAFENTRFSDASRSRNIFDRVFTESSWNADILRDRGFMNVVNWTQGVDTSVFHPAPKRGVFGERFVIYSGGKLEYRKGQDLVVTAFKKFAETHSNALLVVTWYNPWIEHARTINYSPHTSPLPVDAAGKADVAQWLANQGLARNQFVVIDYVPNAMTPSVLRECDVALFPNRAEGGTNLVAMEALACGVPSILAANTGQLDLVGDVPCFPLREQAPIPSLSDNYDTE
ncbi:MAG: glycosyltransferase family 4 protein, partial [Rhodothermales bacterium]|nr:glycosyltransferase family 4 protein [Rhodothermales bacterium]